MASPVTKSARRRHAKNQRNLRNYLAMTKSALKRAILQKHRGGTRRNRRTRKH